MAKLKNNIITKITDHRKPKTKIRFDKESIRNVIGLQNTETDNRTFSGLPLKMFNLIDRESQDNNLQLHYNHYKTVGFFIHKMFLTEFDTHYEFNDLQLYQTRYNLYPNRIDDPFFGEKCFDCIGTGVAITKRHILTPLHVIRGFIVNEETLHDYVFIMGCQINEVNKNRILKSQVFELEKIVFKPDFMNKSDINDICIIRVLNH